MTVGSGTKHEQVLDPIERLSEVLFGLIMVLSFTGSISVASADRDEVRAVLIGAIGCNLAWGLVDGVMYLLTLVIERGRTLALGRAVRASQDPEHGRKLLVEALGDPVGELFESSALEGARKKLSALPDLPKGPRLHKEDWLGALGVFLLVFLSTFPVVLPFLFLSPLHTAMRVVLPFLSLSPLHTAMRISNGVAILMMFIAGRALGRYAGIGPVRTGLVMVAIGVLLVILTIALGG